MPLKEIQIVSSSDAISKSKIDIQGNWIPAIGAVVVSFLISAVLGLIPFAPLVISGPLSLGLAIFFLNIAKGKEPRFEQILDGFKQFATAFFVTILSFLFIFLWSLLLIIPGIMASLSYSMAVFIIAEDKEISALDAITKSKEMMQGNKMELFIMFLIFFGMSLLCLLTLGIGFLWLIPFSYLSFANFYIKVRGGEQDELSLEDNLIL